MICFPVNIFLDSMVSKLLLFLTYSGQQLKYGIGQISFIALN